MIDVWLDSFHLNIVARLTVLFSSLFSNSTLSIIRRQKEEEDIELIDAAKIMG